MRWHRAGCRAWRLIAPVVLDRDPDTTETIMGPAPALGIVHVMVVTFRIILLVFFAWGMPSIIAMPLQHDFCIRLALNEAMQASCLGYGQGSALGRLHIVALCSVLIALPVWVPYYRKHA